MILTMVFRRWWCFHLVFEAVKGLRDDLVEKSPQNSHSVCGLFRPLYAGTGDD